MKDTTVITDKFQITILRDIRTDLGWKKGDVLKLERKNGGLLLKRLEE